VVAHLLIMGVVMTVRFSNTLVAELFQAFWAALRDGEFLTEAAASAGTHRWPGLQFWRSRPVERP
jgi:hypothetical protein